MCLICKNELQIAQEDLSVYKVFTADNLSPYYRMDYSNYIGERIDINESDRITQFDDEYILISDSFIHSFTNLKAARREKDYLSCHLYREHFIIRECSIPKGTKYYCSDNEVASKSIIIGTEIIY